MTREEFLVFCDGLRTCPSIDVSSRLVDLLDSIDRLFPQKNSRAIIDILEAAGSFCDEEPSSLDPDTLVLLLIDVLSITQPLRSQEPPSEYEAEAWGRMTDARREYFERVRRCFSARMSEEEAREMLSGFGQL